MAASIASGIGAAPPRFLRRAAEAVMSISAVRLLLLMGIGPHPNRDELAVTLAHEATHAMRWILEHAGEKQPGTECEAYLVEHIVRQALAEQPLTVQSAFPVRKCKFRALSGTHRP
jgi:uncharacterized protein YjaZ